MPDANDMELVREFAGRNSEPAFAELVRRHINLVYSVALRFTGNPGDAEEVTQAVFILLARKAAGMSDRTVLTGWLYEATRLTASSFLRSQNRRQHWEQEVFMQSNLNAPGSDSLWRQLAPHLEAAMSRLGERDRTLLALRFYENKTGAEAAALLGIREEAAHKRTARALEKLRGFFSKRGVDSTAAIIAKEISVNSVQAAPVALAKSVTAVALAKGAAASASTLTLIKGALKIMAWSKVKTAIVTCAVILFAAGTATVAVKTIHPGEPSFGGKTLTAWLEESKNLVFVPKNETVAENRTRNAILKATYDAVQHIGPKAIPILLKWVANTTNSGGNILAAGCIQRLGPEAKAAVPGLIAILGSDNEMARYSSFNVLQRIGPSAQAALPAILDHIQHDPSESMRSFAVTTLANNGIGKAEPDTVVPILIECLAPTNSAIDRGDTFRALVGLGAKAKTAVPAILPYLNDPDPSVRRTATDALRQIEPSAVTDRSTRQ